MAVDNDADSLDLVRRALEHCEATVYVARDAAAGLRLVIERRPDVLISDIAMPEEDGYALIRKIRALDRDRGGEVPAVALTAFASIEDRQKALLTGYTAYLAKPLDPADLLVVVERLKAERQPSGRAFGPAA